MANETLDPTEENQDTNQDELESIYNLPSYQKDKKTPSADELQRHFDAPSAQEPVYKTKGNEPSNSEERAAKDGADTPNKSDLKKAEDNPESLYNPDGSHQALDRLSRMKPSVKGAFGFAKSNKGKVAIGGAAAGFITLLIVAFFALLPFKILHIMNNLQSRYFASSENAVQHETDVLFSNYLRKNVLPGLRACRGSTVDLNCTPKGNFSGSLVGDLYKGWKTGRLENKIATKYGLEFKYDPQSGSLFMKAPALSASGLDLREFENSNLSLGDFINQSGDSQFKKVSRTQLRAYLDDTLGKGTGFKNVMYRFKVGRLLEEKYGVKRCIIICKVIPGSQEKFDQFADWKDQKKIAAKALIAQRVLEPRSKMLGIVVGCLLDSSCDPVNNLDKTGTCTPGIDCAANGEADSPTEKDMQAELDKLAAQFGSEDVRALYKELSDKGFTQYAIEQIVAKLTGSEAAKEVTSKSLPVVGWANLAFQTIDNVHHAGPRLKKLSYLANTGTMVSMFTMYRSYADEIKTGNVDATIVGSFTDSLGVNPNSKMGGTAEAEQTPLYQSLFKPSPASPSTANIASSLLSQKALAVSPSYLCGNGKPVPEGQLVCDEEMPGNGNAIVNSLSNITNLPGFNIISDLASIWDNSVGKLINGVTGILGDIISYLPGYSNLQDLLSKAISPLIQAVTNWLIPAIASDNMSGGRAFDLAAGGADVAGNDFAHHGLGGQKLSPQQASNIYMQNKQNEYAIWSKQSFIARMFDTSSDYSFVTKMAMATPSSPNLTISSVLKSPITFFGNIAGLLNRPVLAAGPQADPFGIVQYGYPASDPIFTTDPDKYWTENCTTDGKTLDLSKPVNQAWRDSETIGEEGAYMPQNSTTDPCLLIQASVGSAGATFNDSLLTQDDAAGLSSDNTSSSATGTNGGSTAPDGTAQQLALQILNNKKIQLTGRLVLQDVQDAANGQPGTAGAMTSSAILKLILAVGQQNASVTISAIQSGGTGHCKNTPKLFCPNDSHYTGDAVDFSNLNGFGLTGRDDGSIIIIKDAFDILPSGSGLGQSQCGATPSLPSGFITFTDSCDHLHVQVPAGTP